MRKIVSLIIFCLLSLGVSAYGETNFTKVNLILKMDDGKIGNQFFDDFVEEGELEKGETKEDALNRINKKLSFKLKEGLHQSSKNHRFGEYEDAQYTLTVYFIKSNEDGQRASFELELKNNSSGQIEKFTESAKGGIFGSRINLLGDCLKVVGKNSVEEIENIIQGKKKAKRNLDPIFDPIYDTIYD